MLFIRLLQTKSQKLSVFYLSEKKQEIKKFLELMIPGQVAVLSDVRVILQGPR